MEITINAELIERKRFLIRAEVHGNLEMSMEEYQREVQELDRQIMENTRKILDQEHAKLAIEHLNECKYKGMTSLEIRKEMAKYLINLLSPLIDEYTLKGVFRQAYKMKKVELYGKK